MQSAFRCAASVTAAGLATAGITCCADAMSSSGPEHSLPADYHNVGDGFQPEECVAGGAVFLHGRRRLCRLC